MLLKDLSNILVEQKAIASHCLKRYVIVDVYLPKFVSSTSSLSLLILNDGQSLDEMPFAPLLNGLLQNNEITPVLCVGVHCNKDRIEEYATSETLDFAGRGKKAKAYQRFIVEELIPFLHVHYAVESFWQKVIAGFSMGGLSAIDTLWNHRDVFSIAGIFSGSLWWRSKDLGHGYDDHRHRIMHQVIRKGKHRHGQRFYFMTGSMDETADRNNNGVIDSIDDTLDLIRELEQLGYSKEDDIHYFNDENGRHDVPTWGKALPHFLLWALPPTTNESFFDEISNEDEYL
jgi:enterochelin esterase-like enzyme